MTHFSKNPLISIITVVLNNKEYLEETILSVMNQTYKNFEFIIIDGKSTDGTLQIIKKNINKIDYWISEKDIGIYDAMNKGIKKALGNFLIFLNAGDTFENVNILQNIFTRKDIKLYNLIYGDTIVSYKKYKKKLYHKAKDFNLKNLLKFGTSTVCHQSIFINKNIIPYYDSNLKYKGELNWYYDIVENNPNLNYLYINKAFTKYKFGGAGQINYWKNKIEWLKVIKKRYGIIPIIKYFYIPRFIYSFLGTSYLFRKIYLYINKNKIINNKQ